MLPREHRLHPRSRVRNTVRAGVRVRRGHVVVHFVPDEDGKHAAVVVGKAVGSAVQRHRRQRQIRHALASLWDQLPSGSLVVRALPGECDFDNLRRNLQDAVGQL